MALISCPECGKKVSDKAPACPSCGLPLAKGTTPASASTARDSQETKGPLRSAPIQTIEATSKPFKLATLLGSLSIILGFIFVANESAAGGFVFLLIGLAAVVYGRMGAWWYNR